MNKLFFIVLLAAFFSGCSSEEEDKTEEVTGVGSVSGFTTDNNTGAIISDVSVSIDIDTVLSSNDGSYVLGNIPIGNKPIAASKSGYMSHSGSVVVNESSTTTYDIVLLEKNCVQPYSGLVSWWPGDGNANDSVSTNNGQEVNGATYASGLVDNAFSFDGTDDYIIIQNSEELNPTSVITLAMWVKLSATGGHQFLINKFYGNFSNGPNDDSYSMNITPNRNLGLQVETIDNGSLRDNILVTAPVDIFDGNYHFIVGKYDGQAMKLYYDGQEVTNIIRSPGVVSGSIQSSPTTPVRIGAGSNGNADDWFVNGLVDEVNIYNVALSDAQILELYEAGAAGICK